MSSELMNRYPRVADLRRRARQRIPYFAWEYLDSGTGVDQCMQRNEEALAAITLDPQFMKGVFTPDLTTKLFGVPYAAPFGMSPVGLTALMWPRAERILARTAAKHRLPYTLSTAATESPETIGPLTDGMGWFQLYPPRNVEIRRDLLQRASAEGFTTLLVTADVPAAGRRERQVRAGDALALFAATGVELGDLGCRLAPIPRVGEVCRRARHAGHVLLPRHRTGRLPRLGVSAGGSAGVGWSPGTQRRARPSRSRTCRRHRL